MPPSAPSWASIAIAVTLILIFLFGINILNVN